MSATAPATTGTAAAGSEGRDAQAPGGQRDAPQSGDARRHSEAEREKAPVSGGVLNGRAISLPKPTYPQAARNSGAWGKVVVEVMIDEQGKIIEAHAISGHPFLQQAAVQAARQARFEPAMLSGRPVKIKGTINYVFSQP